MDLKPSDINPREINLWWLDEFDKELKELQAVEGYDFDDAHRIALNRMAREYGN